MDKEVHKRYSIAFKKQVVREYESGESATYLGKKYGISGKSTVTRWVNEYGIEGSRYKLMHIQKPEERNRLKELEAENTLLKSVIADLHLDKLMLSSVVTVAGQELGIDLKKLSDPSYRPCLRRKARDEWQFIDGAAHRLVQYQPPSSLSDASATCQTSR